MKTKICTKCGQRKDYYLDFHHKRHNKKTTESSCKKCWSFQTTLYYKNNKEKMDQYRENWRLKKQYGITLETKEKLFISQNKCCAVCGSNKPKGKNWCIDHDHKTGKVRAILCNSCNAALGYVEDNILILQKCIAYLRFHKGKIPPEIYYRKKVATVL